MTKKGKFVCKVARNGSPFQACSFIGQEPLDIKATCFRVNDFDMAFEEGVTYEGKMTKNSKGYWEFKDWREVGRPLKAILNRRSDLYFPVTREVRQEINRLRERGKKVGIYFNLGDEMRVPLRGIIDDLRARIEAIDNEVSGSECTNCGREMNRPSDAAGQYRPVYHENVELTPKRHWFCSKSCKWKWMKEQPQTVL